MFLQEVAVRRWCLSPENSATQLAVGETKTVAEAPVLAVLVLYQAEPNNGHTLPSFCRALNESGLAHRFRLLIYDNSPHQSTMPSEISVPFSYIHDPRNGGLSRAYNTAMEVAEEAGSEWLLLLDQDTLVDANFLRTLSIHLPKAAENRQCAALAPKLLSKSKIISPARVLWGGWVLPVDESSSGFYSREMIALNSGTLLRIATIREIGGFNPVFWLDYLDHWLFNRLYRAGYFIYVLDVALPHDLSLGNIRGVSTARYKNILLAEGEFYRCCKSPVENKVYYLRLAMRAIRRLARPGERRLFLPTLKHLAKHMGQTILSAVMSMRK